MQLSETQLEQLRDALARVKQAQGRRIPREALAALTDALPDDVGMTIDFDAGEVLGHPIVVLRPRKQEPAFLGSLSPREREVAGLVAAGLRNRDIATALGITLGTVKDHVHHILTKSGLDNRAAVASAWSREQ